MWDFFKNNKQIKRLENDFKDIKGNFISLSGYDFSNEEINTKLLEKLKKLNVFLTAIYTNNSNDNYEEYNEFANSDDINTIAQKIKKESNFKIQFINCQFGDLVGLFSEKPHITSFSFIQCKFHHSVSNLHNNFIGNTKLEFSNSTFHRWVDINAPYPKEKAYYYQLVECKKPISFLYNTFEEKFNCTKVNFKDGFKLTGNKFNDGFEFKDNTCESSSFQFEKLTFNSEVEIINQSVSLLKNCKFNDYVYIKVEDDNKIDINGCVFNKNLIIEPNNKKKNEKATLIIKDTHIASAKINNLSLSLENFNQCDLENFKFTNIDWTFNCKDERIDIKDFKRKHLPEDEKTLKLLQNNCKYLRNFYLDQKAFDTAERFYLMDMYINQKLLGENKDNLNRIRECLFYILGFTIFIPLLLTIIGLISIYWGVFIATIILIVFLLISIYLLPKDFIDFCYRVYGWTTKYGSCPSTIAVAFFILSVIFGVIIFLIISSDTSFLQSLSNEVSSFKEIPQTRLFEETLVILFESLSISKVSILGKLSSTSKVIIALISLLQKVFGYSLIVLFFLAIRRKIKFG